MAQDFSSLNPEEQEHRKALGQAMMLFVQKMMEHGIEDASLRRHHQEMFRQAVEKAAAAGIEVALAWHSLGVWTEDGRERIGYFSRALDCVESGRDNHFRTGGPRDEWSDVHMRADCLFEIGRIHFHEGDASVAQEFLLRALPLAQEAEILRGPAKVEHDDRLEGRIAELLVQLPDA